MKVQPFGNSGKAHKELQTIINKLEAYFSKDPFVTEESNKINMPSIPDCDECKSCTLEFFYFWKNNGGYRNGIWIRINGNHNLWVSVLLNPNGAKKVCIFSNPNKNINKYKQEESTFRLPEPVTLPTMFNGLPAFIEKRRVSHNCNVITEIEGRLPYVCI